MRRELTVTLLIFVAAVSFSSPVLAQTIVDRSANNRRVIDAAARLYGFDPELLEAIAKIESNGDSAAISPAAHADLCS